MDAVASAARASKATLYRRWSTKAALVAEQLGPRFESTVAELASLTAFTEVPPWPSWWAPGWRWSPRS
ncbi:TetR family transcriptional regulator [Nocardioides sp. 616]|uniref:TetR family transcriptional regulator n=1 Tax=Nocardioides sp. 616 TaxID=2268090 RepID=UPI001F06CAAD|nr:TetR family transcriptional regulator [Nocardioides sp. 616]